MAQNFEFFLRQFFLALGPNIAAFFTLSKVELVKMAPPFQLVEKTTNLLVNIHYFI